MSFFYLDGLLANTLQKVEIPIISHNECVENNTGAGLPVRENNLCTYMPGGGKGPCFADSGGPATVLQNNTRYVLTGIISWSQSCAALNRPAVYIAISYHNKLINDAIYQSESIQGIYFDPFL